MKFHCGLNIYIGPMFSGKTSKLLTILEKCLIVNLKGLYINHCNDDRTSDNYSTHSSITNKKNIEMIKTKNLTSLQDKIQEYDVLCIDEAQFFDDLTITIDWVNKYKKIIYIGSLNSDFNRNNFGNVKELLSQVDKIKFLYSCCSGCQQNKKYNKAIHTFLIEKVGEGDNIVIGGKDKYISLCRECYNNYNS